MRKPFPFLVAVFLLAAIANTWAAESPKRTIALDSGHMLSAPGALSVCKKFELEYNDALVASAQSELGPAYHVVLTREPGQEVVSPDKSLKGQLNARADLANRGRS